jgi:hypothetical protein
MATHLAQDQDQNHFLKQQRYPSKGMAPKQGANNEFGAAHRTTSIVPDASHNGKTEIEVLQQQMRDLHHRPFLLRGVHCF